MTWIPPEAQITTPEVKKPFVPIEAQGLSEEPRVSFSSDPNAEQTTATQDSLDMIAMQPDAERRKEVQTESQPQDGTGMKMVKAAGSTLAGIAGQGIMKLPKFVQDWNNELFKQSFTKVAGLFGVDKENADHAWNTYDQWAGRVNQSIEKATGGFVDMNDAETYANSPEAKWLTDQSKKLEGESQISDKSILDLAFKTGEYGKAVSKIGVEIARSLPYTLTALGGGTPGLVAMGLTTASKEYDDIKDSHADTAAKLTEATLNGTAEALGEYIGTAQIGKALAGSFKTLGAKQAAANIKTGLEAYMSKILKKYGILATTTSEGVSEWATTIAQNAAAIYTGVDPNRKITDGAADSFIVGAVQGGGMHVGGKALAYGYNKLTDRAQIAQPLPSQAPGQPGQLQAPVTPRQQAQQQAQAFHQQHANVDNGMMQVIGETTPEGDATKYWYIVKGSVNDLDGSVMVVDDEGNQQFRTKSQLEESQDVSVDDFVNLKLSEFDQNEQAQAQQSANTMQYDVDGKKITVTRQQGEDENGEMFDGWIDENGMPVDVSPEAVAEFDKQKQVKPNTPSNVVSRIFGKTQVTGTKDEQGNITVSEPMTVDQANDLREEVERTTNGKATVKTAVIPNDDSTLPDSYQVSIVPMPKGQMSIDEMTVHNARLQQIDNDIIEVQKRLNITQIPPVNISPSTEMTLDKIDSGEPVANEFLKQASAELYQNYKMLEAMKKSNNRAFTTEQIESMQEYLGEEITNLENHATKQTEEGKFISENEVSDASQVGATEDIGKEPEVAYPLDKDGQPDIDNMDEVQLFNYNKETFGEETAIADLKGDIKLVDDKIKKATKKLETADTKTKIKTRLEIKSLTENKVKLEGLIANVPEIVNNSKSETGNINQNNGENAVNQDGLNVNSSQKLQENESTKEKTLQNDTEGRKPDAGNGITADAAVEGNIKKPNLERDNTELGQKVKGRKQIERALLDLDEAKTPQEQFQAIHNFNNTVAIAPDSATPEEKQQIKDWNGQLLSDGYEIPKLLGTKFNQGSKYIVESSIPDESLDEGVETITKVITPQINKDGKMIQVAHVQVTVGTKQRESTPRVVETKPGFEKHIKLVPKKLIQTLDDGTKVFEVDGEFIRNNIFQDWTQGGNEEAYPSFNPKGEIWIESGHTQLDVDATTLHEQTEKKLMATGIKYEPAHDEANKVESKFREQSTQPVPATPSDTNSPEAGAVTVKDAEFGISYANHSYSIDKGKLNSALDKYGFQIVTKGNQFIVSDKSTYESIDGVIFTSKKFTGKDELGKDLVTFVSAVIDARPKRIEDEKAYLETKPTNPPTNGTTPTTASNDGSTKTNNSKPKGEVTAKVTSDSQAGEQRPVNGDSGVKGKGEAEKGSEVVIPEPILKAINESKTVEEAFKKIGTVKTITAEQAKSFREKYDPNGTKTPIQAFTALYNEVKSGKAIEPHPEVSTELSDVINEVSQTRDRQSWINISGDYSRTKWGLLHGVNGQYLYSMNGIETPRSTGSAWEMDEINTDLKLAIKEKDQSNYNFWVREKAQFLENEAQTKLEKADYIETVNIGNGELAYVLTPEGQAFVDAVNARLETRKGVKEGYDLFPNNANISEFNQKVKKQRNGRKPGSTKSIESAVKDAEQLSETASTETEIEQAEQAVVEVTAEIDAKIEEIEGYAVGSKVDFTYLDGSPQSGTITELKGDKATIKSDNGREFKVVTGRIKAQAKQNTDTEGGSDGEYGLSKYTDSTFKKLHLDFKKKYPDVLGIYKVDGTYEIIGDDAINASKILGIPLSKNKDGVSLAGFDSNMIDDYLPKLVKGGFKVGITESEQGTIKAVKRESSSNKSLKPSNGRLNTSKNNRDTSGNNRDTSDRSTPLTEVLSNAKKEKESDSPASQTEQRAQGNPFTDSKEQGNISSASRFKPYETVTFEKPLVGANGAKLTSYKWAYEWTEELSKRDGGLVPKRISDWSQQEQNAETGRGIVHQFTVELPNGEVKTVSSESVLEVLGYTEKTQAKNLPTLVTAVKTLAKQNMQLEILKAQKKQYAEAVKHYEGQPKPNVEIQPEEEWAFIKKRNHEADPARVDSHQRFKMGDVTWDQDNRYNGRTGDFTLIETPSKETIENLTTDWVRKQVEKDGFKNPSIYDLEQRNNRQKKKVDAILESQPKPVDRSVPLDQVLTEGKNSVAFSKKAFHGAPHSFDKFSTDFMGTGEGNQVYGWGLYFTDKKEIAESYATNNQKWEIGGKSYHDFIMGMDSESFDYIKSWYKTDELNPNQIKEALEYWSVNSNSKTPRKALSYFDGKEIKKATNRNLYSVTLHEGKEASEYDYLRWDSALTPSQIAKIKAQGLSEKLMDRWGRDVTNKGYYPNSISMSTGTTGQSLYNQLQHEFDLSDKEASLFLLRAGIDGIQYPSEYQSKGTQEDSFNYVVFDENAITVNEHAMFSIIGERGAKNIEGLIDNLTTAKEMTEAGKDKETVYLATGWELFKDGWKYDLVEDIKLKDIGDKTFMTLAELVDIPYIYKAYPELKDIYVILIEDETHGKNSWAYDQGGVIKAFNYEPRDDNKANNGGEAIVKRAILHEVQHAIQEINGFAGGTSPEDAYETYIRSHLSGRNESVGAGKGKVSYDTVDQVREKLFKETGTTNNEDAGKELYRRYAGETEARNVESRLELTPEQRKEQLISATQDVAEDQKIYLMGAIDRAYSIAEPSEVQDTIDQLENGAKEKTPVYVLDKSSIIQTLISKGESKKNIDSIRRGDFYSLLIGGEIFVNTDYTKTREQTIKKWLHEKMHHRINENYSDPKVREKTFNQVYDIIGKAEIERVVPEEYWQDTNDVQAMEYFAHAVEQLATDGKIDENVNSEAKNYILEWANEFTTIKNIQDAKRNSPSVQLGKTGRNANDSSTNRGTTPQGGNFSKRGTPDSNTGLRQDEVGGIKDVVHANIPNEAGNKSKFPDGGSENGLTGNGEPKPPLDKGTGRTLRYGIDGVGSESRSEGKSDRSKPLTEVLSEAKQVSLAKTKGMDNKTVGKVFANLIDKMSDQTQNDDYNIDGLLYNWNESELNDDRDNIKRWVGRDSYKSMGQDAGANRVSKKAFIEWLQSEEPFNEKTYGKDITTDKEWVKAIETAREAIREITGEKKAVQPLPPTISINGVDRPTTNSKGQVIHPTIEGIKNFWEWFGNSVTTGEKGEPIVLYHGTQSTWSTPELHGLGIHVGSEKAAQQIIKNSRLQISPQIKELYLAINNPLSLSRDYRFHNDLTKVSTELYKDGIINKSEKDEFIRVYSDYATFDNLRKLLTDKYGYDGVVYRNNIEDRGSESYIAFSPNQIKSINNSGSFSPGNNSINYARATPLGTVLNTAHATVRSQRGTTTSMPTSVSDVVENRYVGADGLTKKSVWDTISEKLQEIRESVQHFKYITEKEFPSVYNKLRLFEAIPDRVKKEAYEKIATFIRPIAKDKNLFKAFERHLILQDLINDVDNRLFNGKELPWGYGEGKTWAEGVKDIRTDVANMQAYVNRNPLLAKAVADRTQMMKDVRDDLVKNKFIGDKANDSYFHHQVLDYMLKKLPNTTGVSSRDVRNHKKGWQRSRTGSMRDYNTNYLESEFEVLAQSLEQIEIKSLLSKIGKEINVMPDLVKQSNDANEQIKQDNLLTNDPKQWKKFTTWKDFIPEGYRAWYPKQGTNAYKAASMAEKAVQNILNDPNSPDVAALMAEAEGSMWVIPIKVADQLNSMKDPEKETVIPATIRYMTGKWKQWILLNPYSAIKYNFNNMSGDLDVVLAYNPEILKPKYAHTAMKEAWAELQGKGMSQDMKEALEQGIITSGLSIQEIPDINQASLFRSLVKGQGTWLRKAWNATAVKEWDTTTNYTQFRENVLRVAAYKYFKEQIAQGKNLYAASNKQAIDALTDPNEKAGKLARELLGDYGNLSQGGQWLRSHSFPFWSWMEINAPRYYRMLKNTANEGGKTSATLGRVAGVGAKKTVVNVGMYGVKAMLLMGLVVAWNRLMWPDEDDELTKNGNRQLKLIVGRREDGSIMTVKITGAFSDMLSFLGLEDAHQDYTDLADGNTTAGKLTKEAGNALVNKFAGGMMPLTKTLAEVVTKKSLYPDVLNPRPVRDRVEQGVRIFKMDKIYNYLMHKPSRAFGKEVSSLLVYDNDPGEAAYYTMRQNIFDFMKDEGKEIPAGESTERSNALYYYKQALKLHDDKPGLFYAEDNVTYWLKKYKELGGTADGYKASMKKGKVVSALPLNMRRKWFNSLDGQDKEVFEMANKWYNDTYLKKQ